MYTTVIEFRNVIEKNGYWLLNNNISSHWERYPFSGNESNGWDCGKKWLYYSPRRVRFERLSINIPNRWHAAWQWRRYGIVIIHNCITFLVLHRFHRHIAQWQWKIFLFTFFLSNRETFFFFITEQIPLISQWGILLHSMQRGIAFNIDKWPQKKNIKNFTSTHWNCIIHLIIFFLFFFLFSFFFFVIQFKFIYFY